MLAKAHKRHKFPETGYEQRVVKTYHAIIVKDEEWTKGLNKLQEEHQSYDTH